MAFVKKEEPDNVSIRILITFGSECCSLEDVRYEEVHVEARPEREAPAVLPNAYMQPFARIESRRGKSPEPASVAVPLVVARRANNQQLCHCRNLISLSRCGSRAWLVRFVWKFNVIRRRPVALSLAKMRSVCSVKIREIRSAVLELSPWPGARGPGLAFDRRGLSASEWPGVYLCMHACLGSCVCWRPAGG